MTNRIIKDYERLVVKETIKITIRSVILVLRDKVCLWFTKKHSIKKTCLAINNMIGTFFIMLDFSDKRKKYIALKHEGYKPSEADLDCIETINKLLGTLSKMLQMSYDACVS